MNNKANIGLSAIIIIMVILLIATTAASVMTTSIRNNDDNSNINTLISEVTDEITTYIQIKDIIGRYTIIENQEKIRHIAILVTPLISSEIDISDVIIKICNGYQVRYLYYNGEAGYMDRYPLFHHPIYDRTQPGFFNLIILNDKDQSILNYNTINDQTDLTYIVMTLPEDIALRYDDSLTLTLILPRGQTRTVTLQAPLPIRQVFTFD